MVYRVIGNFTNDNFEKLLTKLCSKFKTLYLNNVLYLALINFNDKDICDDTLKKVFKPARDFFITKIEEGNIMDLEPDALVWCRDNLVELDKQRYEKENQEQLKLTWEAMDRLEDDLKQKLIEKRSKEKPADRDMVDN